MGFVAMYSSEQVLALVSEARTAQTREGGAVLDRHDLLEIILRLSNALESVADERDRLRDERSHLAGRLTRSSHTLLADADPEEVSASPTIVLAAEDGGGSTAAANPHQT